MVSLCERQILAVRLGVVTGKNLAEMCTAVYPRWASITLWIMTEIAIVGRCVITTDIYGF